MTVAELFVNIGVKGADKSTKNLAGVKEGLGGIVSSSLAAKAAILGAMYGLERLMSHSAAQGLALQQFANFTGLSTDRLQRWQVALRHTGVGAEEVAGSFKGLQASMMDMLTGKSSPEYLGLLAQKVGFDMRKAMDPEYVLGKLQQFIKVSGPAMGNMVAKAFGQGENMTQGLRVMRESVNGISSKEILTQGEVKKTAQVAIDWMNINAHIQLAIAKLTAAHGLQFTQDIDKLIPKVFDLIRAFATLAEKLKVFAIIGKVFEGWALIFGEVEKAVDGISESLSESTKTGSVGEGAAKQDKAMIDWFSGLAKDKMMTMSLSGNPLVKALGSVLPMMFPLEEKAAEGLAPQVTPKVVPPQSTSQNQTHNNTVTVNAYGVEKAEDLGPVVSKHVQKAARQSPALGQSN